MNLKAKLRKSLLQMHKLFFKQRYLQVLKLLEPSIFMLYKKGYGKEGDGTYVLPPGLIQNVETTVLLSFGVFDDISFEKDFHVEFPLIPIYAYDPTVAGLPEDISYISFFKWGLAGFSHPQKYLFSFSEILSKSGIQRNQKIILKIDIEGWEWSFLENINCEEFNFSLITMELHFFPLTSKKETLFLPWEFTKKKKLLEKLLKSFYIFHIHANNYEYISFTEFSFPTYLELTLIKKNDFIAEIQKDIKSLHSPTIPENTDIQFPFQK